MIPLTTDPSLSGLESQSVRCSDNFFELCNLLSRSLKLRTFPSPSMRFLKGNLHFFGVLYFNSLIVKLRDMGISLEHLHFCQICYMPKSYNILSMFSSVSFSSSIKAFDSFCIAYCELEILTFFV